MILVSYTNARNETIVLDDTERTFLGELYGREGTEAPEVEYTEVVYADGTTKVLAIRYKPRDVVLYFWAPAGKPHLREKLEEIKQKLIQTGNQNGDWGQLMIRRPDGRPLYLNCVYAGGMYDIVRESWNWIKFSLTFHAEDPLFYDDFEMSYTIQQNDFDGYLFMMPEPQLYMRTDLYMMAANTNTSDGLFLTGEKAYPDIVINGPAKNIAVINNSTGRRIQLDSSVELDTNEKITISTKNRKRSIYLTDKNGDTMNLMSFLTANSSLDWWLIRGGNDITFNNSATTPETYLKFSYKEGFLSAE